MGISISESDHTHYNGYVDFKLLYKCFKCKHVFECIDEVWVDSIGRMLADTIAHSEKSCPECGSKFVNSVPFKKDIDFIDLTEYQEKGEQNE